MRNALLLALFAVTAAASPSDKLLDAMVKVESVGLAHAVGDGGRARGPLQLHAIYVKDVNRIAGTSYTLADRTDSAKSRAMTRIYLTHYGRVYERRTGKPPTDEIYARIHNGGPIGYDKKATKAYWEKVRRVM